MNRHAFTKQKIIIISCFLLAGLLVGSFYDYQISCALFNEQSFFGKIFASYGQLPVTLGNAVIGFILIYVAERKLKIKTILAYVLAILLYAQALMMAVMEPMMYLHLAAPVAVILAIAEIVLTSYVTSRLAKDVDKKDLAHFAGFLAFVIFGQLILINLIKPLAARPRMRMIAKTPEASFQPWWVFGSEMKQTLMASLGIASEEFKSFPSGHAGCAAVALAYCLVPYVRQKGSSEKWFYVGLAFALIVMFSRIIMGAHFLSDVTIGFGVSMICMIVAVKLFYGKEK